MIRLSQIGRLLDLFGLDVGVEKSAGAAGNSLSRPALSWILYRLVFLQHIGMRPDMGRRPGNFAISHGFGRMSTVQPVA